MQRIFIFIELIATKQSEETIILEMFRSSARDNASAQAIIKDSRVAGFDIPSIVLADAPRGTSHFRPCILHLQPHYHRTGRLPLIHRGLAMPAGG